MQAPVMHANNLASFGNCRPLTFRSRDGLLLFEVVVCFCFLVGDRKTEYEQ